MRRVRWANLTANFDELGTWQILPNYAQCGLDEFLRSLIDDAAADAHARYSPSCGDSGEWEFREVARLLQAQVIVDATPELASTANDRERV